MDKIKKGDRVNWIEKIPTNGKKKFYKNTDCVGIIEDFLPDIDSVRVKVITKRYVERMGTDIAIVSCNIISSSRQV